MILRREKSSQDGLGCFKKMRRYFKFRLSNLVLNWVGKGSKERLERIGRKALTDRQTTYQLDADDVPILGIVFVVSVAHQRVVLQDGHPVFVVFHLLAWVGRPSRGDELFDRDRMCVEILQRDVGEERDLVILIEGKIDVGGAGSLCLRGDFVRDCNVCGLDRELILL